MRKTRPSLSTPSLASLRPTLPIAFAAILLAPFVAQAQVSSDSVPSMAEAEASLRLPDAPSALLAKSAAESSSSANIADGTYPQQDNGTVTASGHLSSGTPHVSSPTDITVLPGQTAPHQTMRDKAVGSLKDSISPFSLAGEVISAGYSHVTDGSPNFGTNATAFAQRLGASVARGTSQNLFSEGVLAAVLHEDPRYYQMGSRRPVLTRLFYAGTRPIITRTDGGRLTPNFALLGGYLGAAALTKTYYPSLNQGFSQTLQTYGGSIGGAALGYVVTEFLPGVLQTVHLKKVD